MGDVKANMVDTVNLHLVVDGTCHNVAWCQTQSLVIFLHEFLTCRQAENTSVAAHRLGDEVSRMGFAWVIEGGRVELHEFHVLHLALGTIDHGNAVARGDIWIGSRGIHSTCATRSHQSDFRKVGVDFACVGIQNVGTIAFDVGRATRHTNTEVVLRDDFHGEVVFQNLNVGIVADGCHQSTLDFSTRIVGVVQDAEL